MKDKVEHPAITLLLCACILAVLCAESLLNLTPPISRDALIHHLAIPKLWVENRGFYETPWADYSYYPMYINLLYLPALYFKNDVIPKFIHLAFGLGTGGLIYGYLEQKFGRNRGLLGAFIFISTPIVIWLSTSAYIDLGMTFFTTASILALVKWRDSQCKIFKWLLISGICMGFAAGSKYNALIAWLFVNLTVVYAHAHDAQQQVGAVKYGLVFFVCAAIVASPWYVKNYLLTGNPFYPLFDNFFRSLKHLPVSDVVLRQTAEQAGRLSFFRMREVMYGETFWETILIPLRMFFQGKDDSYQYFQGVLNPILIVFWPFVLLDKKNKGDKIIFSLFCVFFIFVAYFSTRKQVRYIVPVLPFLAITAVMGIENLAGAVSGGRLFPRLNDHPRAALIFSGLVFASIALMLANNGVYLKNRLDIIKPLPYVLGRESREDFLGRHLGHFAAIEYINTRLPKNAVIFTMFMGRRGYYLDRAYKNEPSFGRSTINRLVESSVDAEAFKRCVRTINATHILMRTDLVDNYLRDNFPQHEIDRFMTLAYKHWRLLFKADRHAVWQIDP